MDLFDILDVTLYGLIILDLIYRFIRIRMGTKKMGKLKRYMPGFSTVKLAAYIILGSLSTGYLIYRLIQISNGNYSFIKIAVILPIILYYILSDLMMGGIYYNQYGCYVKNTAIHFGEVKRSFRYVNKEKNGYDYTIYYEPKLSGTVELNFFIKNEPKAFELMSRIPVTQDMGEE